MNIDIFSVVKFWDAGELEPAGNSKKLFTREIAGQTFQFKRSDYKTRWRLGVRTIALAQMLAPLVQAGVKAKDLPDPNDEPDPEKKKAMESERLNLMMEFLPDVLGQADNPELESLIDDLTTEIWVQDGSKMTKIDNEIIAERVFEQDVTLRLPLALTALEVNLAEGFFDRLMSAFSSLKLSDQS